MKSLLSVIFLLILISNTFAADTGFGIFWFRDYPISPKRCSTKTQAWMYNIERQILTNKMKTDRYLSHRQDMENKNYLDESSLENYAAYLEKYVNNANRYEAQLREKYNELLVKDQYDEYRYCMNELERLAVDASINSDYMAWGLRIITNFNKETALKRNCILDQE